MVFVFHVHSPNERVRQTQSAPRGAAQQSDTARQVVELQAEAGGTGAAVKALQRRAEAAGEEQARQAAEVRALQAGLAEAQAAGRCAGGTGGRWGGLSGPKARVQPVRGLSQLICPPGQSGFCR